MYVSLVLNFMWIYEYEYETQIVVMHYTSLVYVPPVLFGGLVSLAHD